MPGRAQKQNGHRVATVARGQDPHRRPQTLELPVGQDHRLPPNDPRQPRRDTTLGVICSSQRQHDVDGASALLRYFFTLNTGEEASNALC
jgi:hypothetical protein